MSSVSKVTVKAGTQKYEWSQTDEYVMIYLPMQNVLLKNIDLFFSDLLLKINAQAIKYFCAIDFSHEIDYKNPKNKTQLVDQRLEVLVHKQVQAQVWSHLEVQGLSKQEAITRRNLSVDRFHASDKIVKERAAKAKYEMEKTVIDEQSALEKH